MKREIRIWLLLSVMLCCFPVWAQKEKNNIYLFDCTGSMITNGIWDSAKESLDATARLDATMPDTHITIIPFGDNPYNVYSFPSNQYPSKSKAIEGDFAKYIKEAKYTNISSVLEEGFKHIDNNKENHLYLLTDGIPNHDDSPEKVARTVERWCGTHKDTKLIYVALTKSALDSKIRKALEDCPDAIVVEVEGNVIPQFPVISNDIYTNLQELDAPREISFSFPGTYDVKALSDDPLFDVKIKNDRATDGKILVSLAPKFSIDSLHQRLQGDEYSFPVEINATDKRFKIVNPIVRVHVSDEIPSKVTLAGGNEALAADGAKWHDSFLWSPEAPQKKITWNLSPVFENSLNNTALKLKFGVPQSVDNDFKAWYNDKEIKNGETITLTPGAPAILSVEFNKDAATGKRYFELTPVGATSVDLVNEQPFDSFEGTTLRTSYSVGWNPLATALFWVIIGVLAFLVIWFILLQRIFYPRIKMSRVEFTGPNSYYASKKIKGTRKVVLTSKNKKQNIFSRIFTGEVKYVKADHFNPEIEIKPSGNKRKVKISNPKAGSQDWDIYPSTIFQRDEKGTLKHRRTQEETDMFFN